jgi:hypothetical protein
MATQQVTMLCAAPTVIRVVTVGAPPSASTIQRLEEELGWTNLPIKDVLVESPQRRFATGTAVVNEGASGYIHLDQSSAWALWGSCAGNSRHPKYLGTRLFFGKDH